MNELVIAPIISWNDVIGFSALSGSKSMGSGLSAILERPKSPIFTCKQKNQKTMQHKWTLAVFIRIPTAHHLAFLCYRAINMRHDIFLPCVSQLVRSGLPCIVKQIRRLDIVVDDLSTSGVQVAQAVPESASCQEIQQFQTQIIILEKVKDHHLMFLRFRMAISWSLYVWIIQAGPRRSENQDLDDDALGFLFWHRPMHLESHVQRFSLTQLQDHGKNCRCTGVYLKVLA